MLVHGHLILKLLYSFSFFQGGKELEAVESAEFDVEPSENDVEDEIGDSENEDTQARDGSWRGTAEVIF